MITAMTSSAPLRGLTVLIARRTFRFAGAARNFAPYGAETRNALGVDALLLRGFASNLLGNNVTNMLYRRCPVSFYGRKKCINEIKIGDKVWAYDVDPEETQLKTVTKVYIHSVDEILHLYTDEGDIDATANHPFYVMGKGWFAAGDLAVGDEVYNLDGTTSTILGFKVEKLTKPILVYNKDILLSQFLSVLLHDILNGNTPDVFF